MLTAALKLKACQQCKREFMPARPLQRVCSAICASRKVKADKKAERITTRARKAAIKTIPQLTKEAQREFNRYIRLRDANQGCICCGQPLGAGSIGGGYDAGHYRSVGSAPHLRFDERNVHAQRKRCNRYGAGRAVEYRAGLITRYGLEFVESIEADQTPKHHTREELIAIRDEYRRKAKELER